MEQVQRIHDLVKYLRFGVSEDPDTLTLAQCQTIFLIMLEQHQNEIYKKYGLPFPELIKQLEIPQPSASRMIKFLSTYLDKDENGEIVEKGMGIVEIARNPLAPQQNAIKLTEKGYELANQIQSMLFN